MKDISWKIIGNGNNHLIMIHGWGLNAQIWNCIKNKLSLHFTLHLPDLPGFGESTGFGIMTLNEIAESILEQAPNRAIWLGWSLGGLVASVVALNHPLRVQALVTVASSPCFIARKSWPGIKTEILSKFQYKLRHNTKHAIEKFIKLQTIKTITAQQDILILKNTIFAVPMFNKEILCNGLEILKTVDLRESLTKLEIPHLRIYGDLDELVPPKIISILDSYWPKSKSLIIPEAAHVPFISHSNQFCKALIDFIYQV